MNEDQASRYLYKNEHSGKPVDSQTTEQITAVDKMTGGSLLACEPTELIRLLQQYPELSVNLSRPVFQNLQAKLDLITDNQAVKELGGINALLERASGLRGALWINGMAGATQLRNKKISSEDLGLAISASQEIIEAYKLLSETQGPTSKRLDLKKEFDRLQSTLIKYRDLCLYFDNTYYWLKLAELKDAVRLLDSPEVSTQQQGRDAILANNEFISRRLYKLTSLKPEEVIKDFNILKLFIEAETSQRMLRSKNILWEDIPETFREIFD